MLDVLIIGAGPIGLACGIEAQKQKLQYQIVEKGLLVNSIYRYPQNMTFFSTSEKLEIGHVPFVSHNPKPTRPEALEYYRRVVMKYQLNLKLYEHVNRIKPEGKTFEIQTDKATYHARNVVMATGFYDHNNRLGVPGDDLEKVHYYYSDPHPYFGQKIVVVGARNSAVDAALECWRKGAEVSMIIRESEISERVKYWVRPDMNNRIKEGSIPAYFNAEISEITQDTVKFKHEGQIQTLPNDFVLAMIGYKPDFKLLQQAGVQLQPDQQMKPVYNPETMESNVKGLYLAGVVCGGLETHKWFIENSRVHARIIMDSISG